MSEFLAQVAIIALCALSICSSARSNNVRLPQKTVSGNTAGWIMFSEYQPKEPTSLEEIPWGIRQKLKEHLVERLGAAFASRLRFSGGQIVNFQELNRTEPDSKRQWKVFAYRIFYSVSLPDKGISEYISAIELDRSGNVMKEISLPPMVRVSGKQAFFSLSQAYGAEKASGLDVRKTTAELTYNEQFESLVYRMQEATCVEPSGEFAAYLAERKLFSTKYRGVDIDAHSGRILRVWTEIRHPHFS